MTLRDRAAAFLHRGRRAADERAEIAAAVDDLTRQQQALAEQLAGLRDALDRNVGGVRQSLDVVEVSNRSLLDQASAGEHTSAGLLLEVRDAVRQVRDDVWASKVVRLGDRLLVGCRHLNLVFLLQASDQLIVPRFVVEGEYEPATTAFLKRVVQHDSVCIDVGANFGYYACLMGHLAWKGTTLAYEADPELHALLVDNIAINWCEGVVRPVNAAIAAEAGELTLYRWINRSGNSGVIRPEDVFGPGSGPVSEPFTVRSVALDSLVGELPRVDLVKIDVEGAESLVVAGMSRFVEHFRPIVVMEWSPFQIEQAGFSPASLAEAIGQWEMDVATVTLGGHLSPLEPEALPSLSYQNVVLAPRGGQ